jgi:hypothetical protein
LDRNELLKMFAAKSEVSSKSEDKW